MLSSMNIAFSRPQIRSIVGIFTRRRAIHVLIGFIFVFGIERFAMAAEKSMNTDPELERQKTKDKATIEALKRNASDVSKPHTLEHHFYVFSIKSVNTLTKRGVELGYEISEVKPGNGQGRNYWYFDLKKPIVPSLENVTKETSLMIKLSREHQAQYDGWGTHVVE
jgi:regulator of ribonuclease activity B